MSTQPLRVVLYRAIRILCWCGLMPLLVRLYARLIRSGTPTRLYRPDAPCTMLALNPDRFRGDLDALAQTGRFNVLTFPFDWQCRILNLFWHRLHDYTSYFQPPAGSLTDQVREDTKAFLRRFLPPLLRILKVDAVISAGVHYRQDLEYGEVAQELGYPYVVFHRENFLTNVGHVRRWESFYGSLGRFHGRAIFTHNQSTRDAFIRFMANPEQVLALGCMRMDAYVRRIRVGRPLRRGRRVALFSFTHFSGLYGLGTSFCPTRDQGFVQLFDHVHGSMARLAAAMPEVEFVIKPKWGGSWLDQVRAAVERAGLRPEDLPNLRVSADLNAQDLILESDVVISFGSTTGLEAAVAGLPVILPFFDEVGVQEYRDYIHLLHDQDAFDIARSQEHLEELIVARLADPSVPAEIMNLRWRLFDKYVSSPDGNAVEQYVDALESMVAESRSGRKGAA